VKRGLTGRCVCVRSGRKDEQVGKKAGGSWKGKRDVPSGAGEHADQSSQALARSEDRKMDEIVERVVEVSSISVQIESSEREEGQLRSWLRRHN
jgi:hypothetical protein